MRLQGGNFDTGRGFLAYSPDVDTTDAYIAYEGSYTDGPFQNPGRYRRDNVNAQLHAELSTTTQKLGFRFIFGRNDFYSSGQIPLDLVDCGPARPLRLHRSDRRRPGEARHRLELLQQELHERRHFQAGRLRRPLAVRSLLELHFYPERSGAWRCFPAARFAPAGRAERAVHASAQVGSIAAVFTAGGNFHDNQINVGLYPREGRVPTGVTTRADAHVTNGAGYAQESLSLLNGRLLLGGGVRFDEFRYDVTDRVNPEQSGVQSAGRWQGKGNARLHAVARHSR